MQRAPASARKLYWRPAAFDRERICLGKQKSIAASARAL
jgi:hypothetical protein